MTLIVPNISDQLALNLILGKSSAPTTQILRLFKNDFNPNKLTVYSDLIEADQLGYVPITLNQSGWVIETLSNITTASYPEQTFNFSTNTQVYGYYVTSTVDSEDYILWVERFNDAPFILPSDGGNISISLNIGAS